LSVLSNIYLFIVFAVLHVAFAALLAALAPSSASSQARQAGKTRTSTRRQEQSGAELLLVTGGFTRISHSFRGMIHVKNKRVF